MTSLSTLKNTSRPTKTSKRLGRGPGSKKGKTCGRGEKGAGSRSGYKTRAGKEGGQFPLFAKSPIRGFNHGKFRKHMFVVNFWQIETCYQDGEVLNEMSLREKGVLKGNFDGIKVLANGELTKKISVEVDAVSQAAREKMEALGVSITLRD